MFQNDVTAKKSESSATEVSIAYDYCRSVTKQHAKSFYFAAKFLPKHKQQPIYAIYALCRHVDDEVDEAEVNGEAEAVAAVDDWKCTLNAIYEGGSPEKIQTPDQLNENRNFVLSAWQDLLKTYRIRSELPLDLMKGVLSDTHVNRYETFDELYVYCYRVASTVGLMSSEIFGYTAPETLEYAEALGIAMQITNILRDIKEDAAMNRIYLPQEDLRRFNVSEQQIFENRLDDNFVELMKFEIERARRYYVEAEKGIALLDRDARFTVLLAARLYARILNEIEKQKYDVFIKRAHTLLSQKFLSIPRIWLQARKF